MHLPPLNCTVAIDLSSNMIEVAKQRSRQFSNIDFQVADVMQWEPTAEQFDPIVSIATLHHLLIESLLPNLKAALKPGGRLIILDLREQESWRDKLSDFVRLWFNLGRKELYIVPGIYGVILWVFPSMLTAIAMVREKEQGTIIQVYASDLSAREWLLGKGLAYLLVASAEALVVMSVSVILFRLRLQVEAMPLIIGTLSFLAASVSFGLLVGTRASNQTAAVQGTAIAGFLTAFLLSDFIYRIENIPFPLSLISNIIPARYYILITRDAFVRGTGWVGVWYVPLIISLIGGVFFMASIRNLKRMQLPD